MTDKGHLQSKIGRVMIGITLVQEIGVVAVALLLPSLGRAKVLIGDIALMLGKAALILAFVTFVSFGLLPLVAARVARSRDKELYLVGALTLGFVTDAMTQAVGLSLPLSAFLAGIVAGGLKYAQDTFAGFLPLRNVCVALF
jgi:CPA2 family monovalent cation:H+ antiporter-2